MLLVSGVLALAAAAAACQPQWARHRELESRRLQAEAALDRLGSATDTANRGSGATDKAHQELLAETLGLVHELRRPWSGLFNQLESAQAGDTGAVHLTQLNVESRFSTLQLVAEGRDLDKLVRFAQRMSTPDSTAGSGPILSLAMTHHEWRDTLGAHVVSASMQGLLRNDTASSGKSSP